MLIAIDRHIADTALDARRNFSASRGELFDQKEFFDRAGQQLDLRSPIAPEHLPKSAGIYLIAAADFSSAYVGLAGNIHHRFHNRQYGHLTAPPETCRAWAVLALGEPKIFLIEGIDYDGEAIAHAEADYYFLLSAAGVNLTNAEWTLGKKGLEGRPVVSTNVRTGEHFLFASVTEATATLFGLGQNPGLVACCLPSGKTGYQDQCSGFTHRYATTEEVAMGQVIRMFDTAWLSELAGRIKNKYERGPISGYVGVTIYCATGLWQVTLNCGRWPTGRVKKFRFTRQYESAKDGAEAREEYIVQNGLQSMNRSNFGGW